jgi:branched-subunit amino acid ABC-type transport system permease component
VASTQTVTASGTTSKGNPTVGETTGIATATCPAGTKLLGGGGVTVQTGVKGAIMLSQPNPQSGTPTGWQAQAVVVVTGNGSIGVTAYAICST